MNFEQTVNEVKDRLETVGEQVKGRLEQAGEQAQGVAKVSIETLKAANDVVIAAVQTLVKTHTEAAKDLYIAGKQNLDKAFSAGLLAVATNPIEYIPDGRDTIVGAFNDTVETFTKTGEKLVKVVKNGYGDVAAAFTGKPVRKAKRAARKAIRKTARKASEAVNAAA